MAIQNMNYDTVAPLPDYYFYSTKSIKQDTTYY
jgi:hypothetical protein